MRRRLHHQHLISFIGPDSAEAVRCWLRSLYVQIPKDERRPEFRAHGDPADDTTPEKAANIEAFNKTIVSLMFDGMA